MLRSSYSTSVLVLFYILLLTMTARAQNDSDYAKKRQAGVYWTTAREEIDRKEYGSAIQNLNKAIELNPMYMYYSDRASTYYQMGNYDNAIADFKILSEHERDRGWAYYMMSRCFFEKQDYGTAINFAKYSLQIDPADEMTLNALGLAYMAAAQYSNAIPIWTKLISMRAEPEYYKNRGASYFNEEQYPQAIADFEYLISNNFGKADDYYNLGRAYYMTANYSRAIAVLDIAIYRDAANEYAYLTRGRCKQKQKSYGAAIADFKAALKIAPDLEEARKDLEACVNASVYGEH